MLEIILVQPEIPQNAGNIARTCAAVGARLTLVRPLGFTVSSRHLKRAGLDYWDHVDLNIVDHFEPDERPTYFFSTKGKKIYTEASFTEDCCLVFGSESQGLPKHYHDTYADQFYTLPMSKNVRSLNLSNTVAIVTYEALRQTCLLSNL